MDGYVITADAMVSSAAQQSGFLGVESARNEFGITVSYWTDLDSIQHWKSNSDHLLAQEHGREKWYKSFKTRIAKVERNYEF